MGARLWPFDYLVCVRDPAAVIDSVAHTGVPADKDSATAQLWLDMNALALTHTVESHRAILFYEDWFTAPDVVIDELQRFLFGGDCAAAPTGAAEATLAFFEPGLRHARGDGSARSLSDGAPNELYRLMRSVAPVNTNRHRRVAAAAQARGIAARARPGSHV